jgi:hypothetical protein
VKQATHLVTSPRSIFQVPIIGFSALLQLAAQVPGTPYSTVPPEKRGTYRKKGGHTSFFTGSMGF